MIFRHPYIALYRATEYLFIYLLFYLDVDCLLKVAMISCFVNRLILPSGQGWTVDKVILILRAVSFCAK